VTTVRRIIYQSLLQSFHHGRIISDPFSKGESLGPNLDLVAHVNEAYTNFYAEEPDRGQKDGILKAHRNFLRDAIYFLYEADRINEAQQWFDYLAQKYPDKAIIENQPDSLPKNLTLDEYAVAVVQIDIGETSQERVTAAIRGMLLQAYYDLAIGEDDRSENLMRLASRVHERYVSKTYKYAGGENRIGLMPFADMKNSVLHFLLDPQNGVPYAARAALATRVGAPTSWLEPSNSGANSETNSVDTISTNSPATNAVPPVLP
jgi:hypothetical protein